MGEKFVTAVVALIVSAMIFGNSALAEPVTIKYPYHLRGYRGPNTVGYLPGDTLAFGALEVDPVTSVVDGKTTVTATQGSVSYPVDWIGSVLFPKEFGRAISYNSNLTGPWVLTAVNGSNTATAITSAVGNVAQLPLVRNVQLLGTGLTPTISWEVPPGTEADRIVVQLLDDVMNMKIYESSPLPITTNSFTVPGGVMVQNHPYVIRIKLEATEEGGLTGSAINRSESFINFKPLEAGGPAAVFLPYVGEDPDPTDEFGASYVFDFDVTQGVTYFIDPIVAVGYDYAIGVKDSVRFASVTLPKAGDDLFDLYLFDGSDFYLAKRNLKAGETFYFGPEGVEVFRILGIEPSAGLDPQNKTAFITGLTFVGSGEFTGTMTPLLNFSMELYDDFSGTSIDKTKWKEGESVRETSDGKLILKQASPSPIAIDAYPYVDYNSLRFADPDSVNSIQADVTILQNDIINQAYTRARLGGRWYNDGTPGGGYAGDIWAEVDIMWTSTGFKGYWYVGRYTGSSSASLTQLGSGYFTTVINIGTQYRLYASYDSVTNQFLFKIGGEAATFGPTGLPTPVGYANQPRKELQTRVQIDNSTSSGYISAAFDNVYKNGVLYDDFSSSIIDATKWTSYEFVTEISGGTFRSKVRSSSESNEARMNSYLRFADPSSVNVIQAKVTPLEYQTNHQTPTDARIGGHFYNDGTTGGGCLGLVTANVYIGGWFGETELVAGWIVNTYNDFEGNDPKTIKSGKFSKPISLGNTYTLLLGWSGTQFTFKIDDEEAHYAPTTSVNPPNVLWKAIGTIIYLPSGLEGIIDASFDDVIVGQTVEDISLSSPLNVSVFDCCSLSTPPIFGWASEESFKGYEIQFSPDQSFSSIPVRMKAKVKESTNEVTLPGATWKKVLTMPGGIGGTVYWRVQGKRGNGTTGLSEVFLLEIEPAQAVGNPTFSPTSKSSLPGLSWENNCNAKFKVWFGSDGSFTKKVPYSFSVKNPNDNGGLFSKNLTSAQWKAIRKLVNDVTGSTIYWYMESWDGLGRYAKTDAMSFFLTD